MLGLGEQVHGHPVRVAAAIGDDQHFGRAGDHVDAHRAEDTPLGRGHIGVARPDDFVDLRNGLRTVSQRRYGLCATDGEHAIDASDGGGGQHQRITFAIRRRHHHDQLAHPGHLGRNGVHQHRARIGRATARHIQADTIERRDDLAQTGAVGFGVVPGFANLAAVVGLDPAGSHFERRALGFGQRGQRIFQRMSGQFERRHMIDLQPVESPGVVDHGRVTHRAHSGENVSDRIFDLRISATLESQQGVERGQKIGGAGVESANLRRVHGFTAPAKASITGCNSSRLTLSAA